MKGIRRTPGDSTEDREKYWEKTIAKARAYPSGVTAFCRVHHIRKDNYYQWFKRLKLKHPEWSASVSTTKSWPRKLQAAFVPIIVKEESEKVKPGANPKQERASSKQVIEIRMLRGHTILVPEEIDAKILKALLEELGKAP